MGTPLNQTELKALALPNATLIKGSIPGVRIERADINEGLLVFWGEAGKEPFEASAQLPHAIDEEKSVLAVVDGELRAILART